MIQVPNPIGGRVASVRCRAEQPHPVVWKSLSVQIKFDNRFSLGRNFGAERIHGRPGDAIESSVDIRGDLDAGGGAVEISLRANRISRPAMRTVPFVKTECPACIRIDAVDRCGESQRRRDITR